MRPLHLETLELTNFRAYRTATLALPPTGLLFLAGANNAGKSALLSALDLVVRGTSPTMPRHAASAEPARVRARFVLSEQERDRLVARTPLPLSKVEAFAWLELGYVEVPGHGLHLSELTASWPGRPAGVVLARVEVSSGPSYVFKVNDAVEILLQGGPAAASVTARPAAVAELHDQRSGEGLFELLDQPFLSRMPSLGPVVEALGAWRERYYHFNALRQGTTWTHRLLSTPVLDPTGVNLPAVLVDLQHNRPDAWESVRELLQRIVPEVGVLETRTEGEQVEVVFADPWVPGYRPNLKNLGTGVEQLLLTIIVGVTQPAPSIMVIEEPETNLHPGAQRALLAQLREWSADRLFIVSTHSSVFLDRAPTAATAFLVERAHGASTVRQLEREPSEALAALGVQLSDVLSADRLLLVEGESDREILTVWFPQLLSDPRVEVAIGHGGDNARFAGVLADWLQAVDRQHRRRVLYLRDRDELSPEALARLAAVPAVYVLQRRELENYLLDPDAVMAALVDWGLIAASTADRAAVEEALREAADGLLPEVVLKRVAGELASQRLVDRKLIAALIREGATLERLLASVTGRLPSDQVGEELTERWVAVEQELQAMWEKHWRELAPGSDVLAYLWRTHGRSYDKLHDGLAIARHSRAPAELEEILQRFMGD